MIYDVAQMSYEPLTWLFFGYIFAIPSFYPKIKRLNIILQVLIPYTPSFIREKQKF